jgi:hypothetical protein
MLLNIEEKRMTKEMRQRKPNRPSVRKLHSELQRLRRRVEDLEDLRDLNAAIERNAGKPGVLWSEVKKDLGVE